MIDNVQQHTQGRIQFVTLTHEEREHKKALEANREGLTISFAGLLREGDSADFAILYDWELFNRYAQKLAVDQAFILHLDHYLPLFAAGYSPPLPLSGIYFSGALQRTAMSANNWMEDNSLLQKFILSRALRQENLKTLFVLDELVVEEWREQDGGHKVTFLPDVVFANTVSEQETAALHVSLQIEPGRTIFLFFGHLTRRKGLDKLLTAVEGLPNSFQQQICLLVTGAVPHYYLDKLQRRIKELQALQTLQIIPQFGFVPEKDIDGYFKLADAVLIPYQKHAGMSGVLLRAAAAGKPVLSSDYGLMGDLVRQNQLGVTIDSTDPLQIAAALKQFLLDDPQFLADRKKMETFISQYVNDRFAAAVFDHFGLLDE